MHFWLILAIIIALIALWLIMCAPSRQRARCRAWKGTLFAHRGLYGDDCAENSLGAFERACRAGYGMELDVQFSRDKKLVIFHDDDLMRMTGVEGAVRD